METDDDGGPRSPCSGGAGAARSSWTCRPCRARLDRRVLVHLLAMRPLTPSNWSGGRRSLIEAQRGDPVAPEHCASSRAGDLQLVDAAWVAEILADRSRDVVLLEAHFTSDDHPFDGGRPSPAHLPGAIQVHPSYLEAGTNKAKYYPCYSHPADGSILPGPALVRALEALAIDPDTLVIVYGTEPDGVMAAARVAWGLMYAGVKRIRLLDGGLEAWIRAGGATVPHIHTVWSLAGRRAGTRRRRGGWRVREDYLATTADVGAIAAGGQPGAGKLVDVRHTGEWDGSLPNYYCFFARAGHIPTALHQGNWDNLVHAESMSLGPQLRAVFERWYRQGIIDPDVEAGRTALVFYCGTGWRSSIAFLVAHLLGLRARNYDGGFYRWSYCGRREIVTRVLPGPPGPACTS